MTSLLRRRRRGRPPHPDVLTPAEWRVLETLRRGHSNPEIAEELGVSLNTVKTHVSSMLGKLELPGRNELARWRGEPSARSHGTVAAISMFIRTHRGAFAATGAATAVVALFAFALWAGRPTGTATPAIVALADLNLPRGRILYLCGLRWCSIDADGSGKVELSELPQNVVEIAPSPDGARLAYLEMAPDSRWLGVANADGTQPRRLVEARAVHDPVPPVWSPDGRTIYVEHGSTVEGLGGPTEILAVDPNSGEARVLVDSATSGSGHSISPDGRTVAFASDREGNSDIFTIPATGGRPTQLTTSPGPETTPAWLPDGRLVYVGQPEGNWELLAMNADGSGRVNLTRHSGGDIVLPVGHSPPPVSPDGKWVAFQSDRSGSIELYVARTDGSAIRPTTSAAHGNLGIPVWSPDSSYLAYFAVMNDQRGMWITRIADGVTAYLGDGLPAAWLP